MCAFLWKRRTAKIPYFIISANDYTDHSSVHSYRTFYDLWVHDTAWEHHAIYYDLIQKE